MDLSMLLGGRMLPFTAVDTAQNSMHCKLVARPWHLVPTIDLSAHASQCCVDPHVVLGSSSLDTVCSDFWQSGFSVSSRCCWSNSRCSQPVNLDRCSRSVVFVAAQVAGSSLTPLRPSTPTSNVLPLPGNLLFSCTRASPLSQAFCAQSAGFLHPDTLAMVSSQRATASCTHKTWAWRCLTLPTQCHEAVALDAVASTRTRGFTTLAISAAMATAPKQLLVKA